MRILRRGFGIALFVALLVFGWRFAALNDAPVSIAIPFGPRVEDISLWMALAGAGALGVAAGGCAGLIQIARLGLLARRYRKAASGLEAEIHQLRTLPLAADERAPRGSAGGAPELTGSAAPARRGV